MDYTKEDLKGLASKEIAQEELNNAIRAVKLRLRRIERYEKSIESLKKEIESIEKGETMIDDSCEKSPSDSRDW